MADPTPAVRQAVYQRDMFRCVLCGATGSLTFQHRQAVGMGGSKVRPSISDGVTLCASCNRDVEGHLQTEAVVYGVKVRRWVTDPGLVPVFNMPLRLWTRQPSDGSYEPPLHPCEAFAAMRAIYGHEWDRWADSLRTPLGLNGRTQ